MISRLGKISEILDSELNFLQLSAPQQEERSFHIPYGMHHNSERNGIVGLYEIASDNRTQNFNYLPVHRRINHPINKANEGDKLVGNLVQKVAS